MYNYMYIMYNYIYIYISLYYHTPLVCFFRWDRWSWDDSISASMLSDSEYIPVFQTPKSISLFLWFHLIIVSHMWGGVQNISKPKNLQPDLLPIFQVTQK